MDADGNSDVMDDSPLPPEVKLPAPGTLTVTGIAGCESVPAVVAGQPFTVAGEGFEADRTVV